MSDVRCPMCSKANPEDAEVCEFCGARLKPLVGGPGQEGQSDQPADAGEGDVPDWLARIRERAEQEIPEAPQPPASEGEEEEDLDWLDRLRSAEPPEKGPPEGEVPDWVEAEGSGEEASPEAEADRSTEPEEGPSEDWLQDLRQGTQEVDEQDVGQPEPAEPEPTEPEPPEGLPSEPETFEAEAELPAEEPSEAGLGGDEGEDEASEPAATGELPGWLSDTDVDFDSMQGPPEKEEETPTGPLDAEQESEPPEWFGEFERAAEEPTEEAAPEFPPEAGPPDQIPEDEGELPDWLDDVEQPEAEGEVPAPAFRDEDEKREPEADQFEEPPGPPEEEPEPGPEPPVVEPEPAEPKSAGEAADWSEFDWDDLSQEELEEAAAEPDARPEAEDEEDELPHVPALITGEEGGPRFEETEDFDLDAIELPDWLAEAQSGEGEGAEPAQEGDLAPATIPSWLEAMRPVETFQPVVDVEPEEEEVVESVGPLAGLRGVLLAEPVVAKPRTATATGTSLQVTERQYAQAELLERIVEDEEHERTIPRRERRRLPLVRWLAAFVLLVAVLVPPLTGLPAFATPDRVSRDLGPLVETVNALPNDRPALVVFDYEPGYNAELEAVTGALLEHLFAQQVSVVTVSTRPTGPPLAVNLVAESGEPHAVENGRDYLHLGYLSGGPTAVQLFSAAPRQSILEGFMVPEDLPGDSRWDAPILRNVEQLQDFGMVAVVSSGTDNARTWAEQAHPFIGETPLIMVLSAGAEPLIRPYFESLDPQVDGILTGLRSAVAYEQINGRLGPARARWDAFGAGILAVEGILLAGVVYGAVSWFINRRRE